MLLNLEAFVNIDSCFITFTLTAHTRCYQVTDINELASCKIRTSLCAGGNGGISFL